jgi:hypothetical protein
MATKGGPNIVKDGLVLYYDRYNQNSYPTGIGNKMNDLAGVSNLQLNSYGVTSSSGLSWANTVSNITISLLLEKVTTTTEYAYHPVSKWGATLQTTSFVLYHFGNYQSNGQDGVLGWYAGAGNVWQQIAPYGFGIMTTGKIWNIVLQYSNSSGGQSWVNGSKTGSRIASGVLGNGGSSGDIVIYGPDTNGTSKVHQIMFYNRELTDDEIINNYNVYYKPRVRT